MLIITWAYQDKLDEAINAYKKSISLKPDYAIIWVMFFKIKKDEALDAYKKAITINPNYADAHLIGDCFQRSR